MTGSIPIPAGPSALSSLSAGQRQVLCLQELTKVLSAERLAKFYQPSTVAPWEALANYAWNVALCEALYPLLHQVEVVFRNALNDAIAPAYATGGVFTDVDSWMDSPRTPLTSYARSEVSKAKKKLLGWDDQRQTYNRSPTLIQHADLVAAVDFGFWTGLMHRTYLFQNSNDKRFWPHLLPAVFPAYNGKHDRAFLGVASTIANDIRKLRNRVFHHEPIWRRASLAGERAQMLKLMGWTCPAAERIVGTLDRLPHVLSNTFVRELRVNIYRETRV